MRNAPKMFAFTLTDDDGEERRIEVPSSFEVCDRCNGTGTHVNPAVDGHGISQEEFDEDPDFEEAYFSGVYDVRCYECDGLRVVSVPNWDRVDPAIVAAYEEQQRDLAECDAISRAERAMGA